MKASEFIQLVDSESQDNWKNSDFPASWEKALETIAEHYRHCSDCRFDFDNWSEAKDGNTLQSLFQCHISDPTKLKNWICNRNKPN